MRLYLFLLPIGLAVSGAAAAETPAACAAEARYPTPDDPTGKNFDAIDAERAIKICTAALAKAPSDAGTLANLGRALDKAERPAEALEMYRRAAAAGSAQGMRNLAISYEHGEGIAKDPKAAFAWMKKAADRRHVMSLYNLAGYHAAGLGTVKDEAKAVELYRLAAAAGDRGSLFELGRAYDEGLGVAVDETAAVAWYRKAAEAGLPSAMNNLAVQYENGDGVERNLAEAIKWYRRAAEAGDDWALYNLGYLNAQGLVTPGRADREEAARLYRKAADKGNVRAMTALADAYLFGMGVPQDSAMASQWFRKAGDEGDAVTKIAVAPRFGKADGVERDANYAIKLLEAAAAEDESASQPLAELLLIEPPSPERHARALGLIVSAADRREGWALAALAHPGPLLRPLAPQIDTARWQAAIKDEKKAETLFAVAAALQAGTLADQNFGLAARYVAAAPDPLDAKEHELSMLFELRLSDAALKRLGDFLESDTFKSAPLERQERFTTALDGRLARMAPPAGTDVVSHLAKLAERGLPKAASLLAFRLANPREGEPNHVDAVRWYRASIERGNVEANNNLGYQYSLGRGVPKDNAAAFRHYMLAAEAGVAIAKRNVGMMLLAGEGVDKNFAEALRWLKEAAAGADYPATVAAAQMYFEGKGTERDNAKAVALLTEAIQCGYNEARVELARAYLVGAGVPHDPAAALRWLKHAARHEGPAGAVGMLRASVLGWGMAPSRPDAQRWLLEAKSRGSSEAEEWIKACGERPSLACLRKAKGFALEAIGLRSVEKPAEAFEVAEARLRQTMEKAEIGARSHLDTSLAYSALETHYFLYDRADALFEVSVRRLLNDEARLIRAYGTKDNYFALVESSCLWSTAARQAQMLGRPEAALFFAKGAVNRLQDARKRIADLDDDIRECFLTVHRDRYRHLADLFMGMGRYVEAEDVLAMLKDFEHYNYTRDGSAQAKSLEHMPSSEQERKSDTTFEQAAGSIAHASAAEARLLQIKAGGTQLTAEQQTELSAATTALETARRAFQERVEQLRQDLVALDSKPEKTDSRALERLSEVNSRTRRLIKEKFGPTAAAVHAVVLPDRVHWLVTTAGYQKAVVAPVELAKLRVAIGDYRRAIEARDPAAAAKAKGIYDLIFKPVDAELKAAKVKNVMLSLDESLRYLPFAALHDGKDWLVQRYAFSSFRDLDDLGIDQSEGAKWTVAGFGASKGSGELSALPAVVEELATIVSENGDAGALPGIVQLDEKFSRETLAGALKEDYKVIHIASHFALNPTNADQSFLLTGSGDPVKLSEFAGLEFMNADLLALSACQTAVSAAGADGSEVDSIAEVAQKSGAPSVLASLWKVADSSTAKLMSSFYRAKSGAAVSKGDALRTAQLAMIAGGADGDPSSADRAGLQKDGAPAAAKAGFDHPFHWAPFILLGNWK